MAELTEKHKLFADYYIETGNATEAYKRAYKTVKNDNTAKAAASRLLTNVNLKKYIEERNKQLETPRIATMTEVKEFWSNMLRNENVEPKDRLKASEYIAKTNAAFTDNHNVNGNLLVKIVDDIEDDIDDCE